MTPAELKTLIESDTEAAGHFAAGRDTQCAERCSQIAPQVYRECRLRWNRLVALYSSLALAAAVKTKIDAAAAQSPIVAEIAKSLEASSQDPCDLGHTTVRALLTIATNTGGIGLTAEEAAPLLAAGRQLQTITSDEVSRCRQL